jgi:exopolysaccharide biosynthesis polyprenyl glycosylphosphotransferase
VRVKGRGEWAGLLWTLLIGALAAAWASSEVGIEAEAPTALRPVAAPEPVAVPDISEHAIRRRGWLLRRALLVADVAALVAAIAVADMARGAVQLTETAIWLLGAGVVGLWVLAAHAYGLYANDELQAHRPTSDDVPGVVLLVTLTTWLGLLALDLIGLGAPELRPAAVFWGCAIGLVLAGRASARGIVQRRFVLCERTLIVGAGEVGDQIARNLARRPEYGLGVIGFVDDDPAAEIDGAPHLGETGRIQSVIRGHRVERVIFAFTNMPRSEQLEILQSCMDLGVQVDIVPRLHEVIGSRVQAHDLDGLPLLGLRAPELSRSSRFLKRALDIIGAALLLVLLAPLFAYIAIRIKLESPGPVLFLQDRIGEAERRFRIFKFRTMYVNAEERKAALEHLNKHTEPPPRMFKITDDPRVTRSGRFLRRWSLDELPQLWNVLRGEMSLVGPRPLIPDEDEHVVGAGRQRLRLTPGITGLWQVLGRSDVPFREMITLDYLYVTNWSLWGDIKLLVRTVPRVLQGSGTY